MVDWLLEAVEELEKGIGQTSESSAGELGADAGADVDAQNEPAQNGSSTVDGGSAVEHVRRQMDRLDTDDASKDG